MNNDIEISARRLTLMTVEDLKSALKFETRPEVLRRALVLGANGMGYGSGKTAARMISAALKRAEKDERKKSLGETERNTACTTSQQKKDGLNWCGKDHSSFDEYACKFCSGIGYVDDDSTVATPCDVCNGSGHYEDICCDYHLEQEQING